MVWPDRIFQEKKAKVLQVASQVCCLLRCKLFVYIVAEFDFVPQFCAEVRKHPWRVQQVRYWCKDLETRTSGAMWRQRASCARPAVAAVLHANDFVAAVLETAYRFDQLFVGASTGMALDETAFTRFATEPLVDR